MQCQWCRAFLNRNVRIDVKHVYIDVPIDVSGMEKVGIKSICVCSFKPKPNKRNQAPISYVPALPLSSSH